VWAFSLTVRTLATLITVTGWQLSDERHRLSIEKGTENVPDDGRFHVLVDGEIVLSTRVEAAAIAEFEDQRNRLNADRDRRLRELRGDTAYRLMRNQSWKAKAARDSKRGGRGIGR
jgi:hypothetical protein